MSIGRASTSRANFLLVALLLCVLAAGCASRQSHVKVYETRGELFIRGVPAAGALVILHPTNPNADVFTSGFPRATVNAEGQFVVNTFDDDDGAPAGNYVLLVSRPLRGDGEDPEAAEPWRASNASDGFSQLTGDELLAARYSDPRQSPLFITVRPQQVNQLPRIEL